MWAERNNLMLNRKKTREIVFVDNKRKRHFASPPLLPEIDRVTSFKILGVTMTEGLSASDHVRDVITGCAQTLYALRVLRTHGMGDPALHTVYQSVVVSRVMYASSAWWGFTNAVDRQRVDAFFRRSKGSGYCSSDLPSFGEMCEGGSRPATF